ncbi:MAG: DUF4198 domain-containing protein [Pseudomonadota bacterium]
MKRLKLFIVACVVFCMTAAAANAHMLWLTPENNNPKPGQPLTVIIGFGHHFAPDEVMKKADRMEQVYALAPDGAKIDLKAVNASTYTFTPQVNGPYVIYASMKSGCMSTTIEGRKMGNRKTLENVVSCFGFQMAAMTTVTCGPVSDVKYEQNALTVEVIPRKNPDQVKVGDHLPMLVLYQGKPLADATLSAVGSNCKLAKEQSWDQEVKTDADGVAIVKITAGGPWLFSVRHKIPYSDPETCDDMMYNTALTLAF